MKRLKLFFIVGICLLTACSKNQEINHADMSQVQAQSTVEQSFTPSFETGNSVQEAPDNYFDDDYFDDEYYEEQDTPKDSFKYWNKFWFHVNDFFLLKIAKPVYGAYTTVVPAKMRSGLLNFKENLQTPIRMSNAVLQGEFDQFFVEFGKFMINSMTSLGFADVASQNEILVPSTPEFLRFGSTLAKWGVPKGPYLILPFFGPSTIREGVGVLGDMAASPQRYILPWEANLFLTVPLEVNNLGNAINAYEAIVSNSIDPYVSLRSVYMEHLKYLDAQLVKTND